MQVSTKGVQLEDQAMRVLAEVCGVYTHRNEALVNAGLLALSRESSSFPGFATVAEHPNWHVKTISQEHGILACADGEERVDETFGVGKKLLLHISHSCITAAGHPYYYVVDEFDMVKEIWHPWKWW
jgi:D-serine deaminase-like pyridoxal phosphate-dependent protein